MDSRAWDDRYAEADRLWSVGPNLFVEDRLAVAQPGRGIDLASGEGRNAVWLQGLGWEMTAVDFSEVAVQRGREASRDVDFVVADVTTWSPSEPVDLVLIAYLHLEPSMLQPIVESARGWLRKGGELFLIGHDKSNIEHGYGGPQYPEILWEVETIEAWVEGLRLVESRVVRRPVELDGDLVFALDTLVRARVVETSG